MAMNWQKPKKPNPHTGGLVVFHSDDGRMFDRTHFVPTIQRAIHRNNQFNTKKTAVFCPAVNAGYIPGGKERQYNFDVMQPDDLRYIVDNGGEILSHTRFHIWLSYTPISQALAAGASIIYHTESWARFYEGYTFFIEEGSLKETFTVTKVNNGNGSPNSIEITPALTNAYTVAAKLHMTEETAIDGFQGNINDLAAMGITCKHHINPWYSNSAIAKVWLQRYFESVITEGGVVDPNNFDLHALKRSKDIRHYTPAEIDADLLATKNNNTVIFVQAHGMTDRKVLANYEYFIDKAYELGMKIVNHSEAIKFLTKQ